LETKKGKIMKKTLLCALLAAAFAAPAVAGDSTNLTVSATVTGTCKFNTGPFTMTFPPLDPSVAANQNTSSTLTYKCTKNQAATSFSFDTDAISPASVNITNGTDNIPVTLTWAVGATVGLGFGAGADLSLTVNGAILGTDYANVSAGTYTKIVAVVVAP
jgi:spore coat protein U-like protein